MIEPVLDPRDPRLADYRDLRDAEARRGRGLFVAESRLVVRRLIAAGRFRVRSLLLTATARADLQDALACLAPGVPVLVADPPILKAVAGFDFHRGCLALGERGVPPPLETLLATGPRLLVVGERVTGPDNVGGVFRNAAAFGAEGVVLSPGSGDALSRKAIRVSAGATLELPCALPDDWSGALAALSAAGLTLIALTPAASALDVDDLDPLPARAALLVGTEGSGLGREALAAADVAVRIPMAPGVDSLNVAAATAIALHRMARLRRGAGEPPSR
jgi:tRNA G18 (ribose-2'-O)-methylase SpoU